MCTFLCMYLSHQFPCPVNFIHHQILYSPPCLFNSRRQLHAAWVLLPALLSGKFLKAISSANSRAFLFACQHSGLMHLLSDVLCLEKLLFQLFYLFYDCFRSKVNSVPVISSFKDFFNFYFFIFIFLVELGLRCCVRAFSRCGE